MSEKAEEYLRMAAEAERQARQAQSSEERAAYARIAAIWRDLANTRERLKQNS